MTGKVVDDVGAEKERGNSKGPDPHLGGAQFAAKIRVFLIEILCVHIVASNEILITYLKCNVSLI